MIKFNFTLSDIDAENFMTLLKSNINFNNEKIQDEMLNDNEFVINAYKRDNEYINSLIEIVRQGIEHI